MARTYIVSRIELPNGDICNLKANGIGPYFVEGPDSDATAGVWTGVIDGLDAYYDGLTLIYVPNVKGATTTTLNINHLGAKTCYYNGTTKLSTQYPVGTPILLTYYGGRWMRADYNTNTTYNVFTTIGYGNGAYKASAPVYRYEMLFQVDEDTLTPLNSVDNGFDSTSKAMFTDVEFMPFGEILYNASSAAIASEAGEDIVMTNVVYSRGTLDLRYTFNCGRTLEASKNVYLKVRPQANGKVKIADAMPLTQALPTTEDGLWYIFLGRTYSTYQMALYPRHRIYCHDGTGIREVYGIEPASTTASGLMSASDKQKLDAVNAVTVVDPSDFFDWTAALDDPSTVQMLRGLHLDTAQRLYIQNGRLYLSLIIPVNGETRLTNQRGLFGIAEAYRPTSGTTFVCIRPFWYRDGITGAAATVNVSGGMLTVDSNGILKYWGPNIEDKVGMFYAEGSYPINVAVENIS